MYIHISLDLLSVYSLQKQFIVNLDGDVEIEVSCGEKRVIRAGEVFFVEDTTGKLMIRRCYGGSFGCTYIFNILTA